MINSFLKCWLKITDICNLFYVNIFEMFMFYVKPIMHIWKETKPTLSNKSVSQLVLFNQYNKIWIIYTHCCCSTLVFTEICWKPWPFEECTCARTHTNPHLPLHWLGWQYVSFCRLLAYRHHIHFNIRATLLDATVSMRMSTKEEFTLPRHTHIGWLLQHSPPGT